MSEIRFTLPHGLVDASGVTHREGVMRPATARDEIEALGDPEVRRNEARLSSLVLAKTVRSIGEFEPVDLDLIEELPAPDFDHLQRLYERLNAPVPVLGHVVCPHCARGYDVDLTALEDGRLGE